VLPSELHDAIAGDGIELYFQPKVNMPSGSVIGLEALVRWHHPELGLLPPSAFVPLAEQTGGIWGLSLRVLDLALAERSLWSGAGQPIPVAINVSARILRNPHLVDEIAARLKRAGVPPQNLLLEIGEGQGTRDAKSEHSVIRQLAEMGVMVAIDDFGFGHSSFANLRDLPIDELKIDRTLVAGAVHCKTDSAIARCIIDLGHRLGVRVVAEGIENEETWRLLSNFGCENAQGYLIARPMPAHEMDKWLRTAGRRAFPRPAAALLSDRAVSA
jgi:EAL domain-containing protein (putative c-di-GMP-specific phosphodiesterase class I)